MNIFKVSDGNLIHIQKERINTGSKNFFKIQIVFDKSWDNFSKLRFAELYQNIDCTHFKIQIGEDGIIDIPIDFLLYSLPIYIGISAEDEDGIINANTNFLQLPTVYGANTKKDGVLYPEELNNVFNIFSSDINLRYLRINNGVLEFSPNNSLWIPISGSGGGSGVVIDYEKVKEIVLDEIQGLASEQYVDESIANLINSAPETLDTLGEIAELLEDNQSTIKLLNNAIGKKADKTLIGTLPSDDTTVMDAIVSSEKRANTYTDNEILKIVNNLTIATENTAGLVKSSSLIDYISVKDSGEMFVNGISLDKIYQAEDEEVILDGGNSNNI